MFSFQVQYHHHCLSSRLTDLWKTCRHSDINIYVEDRIFSCHRVVLASMSAYFDAMFISDMKETREGVVYLKNMKAYVFEAILKYIYQGDTSDMFPDLAVDVLYASGLLQITTLQELCEKYFADNLSFNNCLEIWRLSCTMNCISLKDNSWIYFMDNFIDVSCTDEYLDITKDELLLAIGDDNMNVENEELVCDAALRWFEFDRRRTVYLLEIFQNLRLALMSYSYIECILRRKAFLHENSECTDLLEQMKHVSSRAEVVYGQPHILRERNEHVLVMVDGRRQEVTCYSIVRKKSFSLARFPYFADGKAACTYQDDIFVSGGTTSYGSAENRFVRFETKRNRWQCCADLKQARCYHELVTVGDSIFSIGGFSSEDAVSSIERYDIELNLWTKVGHLPLPVGGMSATALNGIIFIYGGKKSRVDQKTSYFQCFDTKTGVSTILGNLPIPTCWSKAITADNVMYVFCPDGYVIASSFHSFPAIVSVTKKFDCKNFSVVNYRGELIIIQSGENKHHDLLRVYDTCSGHLSGGRDTLPRSLCDSDWLMVNINRCHLKYECPHACHR